MSREGVSLFPVCNAIKKAVFPCYFAYNCTKYLHLINQDKKVRVSQHFLYAQGCIKHTYYHIPLEQLHCTYCLDNNNFHIIWYSITGSVSDRRGAHTHWAMTSTVKLVLTTAINMIFNHITQWFIIHIKASLLVCMPMTSRKWLSTFTYEGNSVTQRIVAHLKMARSGVPYNSYHI